MAGSAEYDLLDVLYREVSGTVSARLAEEAVVQLQLLKTREEEKRKRLTEAGFL